MKKNKLTYGFSLIEVMIVLGIAAVGSLAIAELMVKNAKVQKSIAQAGDADTLYSALRSYLDQTTGCLITISNNDISINLAGSAIAAGNSWGDLNIQSFTGTAPSGTVQTYISTNFPNVSPNTDYSDLIPLTLQLLKKGTGPTATQTIIKTLFFKARGVASPFDCSGQPTQQQIADNLISDPAFITAVRDAVTSQICTSLGFTSGVCGIVAKAKTCVTATDRLTGYNATSGEPVCSGTTTLNVAALTASGNIRSTGGTLDIFGAATLRSTLSVVGKTTTSGTLQTNGILDVRNVIKNDGIGNWGRVELNDHLTVTGTIFTNLIMGKSTIDPDITITAHTLPSSAGDVIINSTTSIADSTVKGDITLTAADDLMLKAAGYAEIQGGPIILDPLNSTVTSPDQTYCGELAITSANNIVCRP